MKKELFKKIFAQSYIWILLLVMYLPILTLIAFSFTTATNLGTWTGFSLDLYSELFRDAEIMIALGNTLIIAFTSALVSVLLATFGAIGVFYSRKHMKNALEVATQIPVVNPEIVIALSLTVSFVFAQSYFFAGQGSIFSYWTLLIGHVVLSLPFVYLSVKPKLQQMDPSLYEAALDLGCTPALALRKVIFPEIMPGVASGFLLAITLSLDDFIVTAFTRGTGLLNGSGKIETLSTLVQSKIKKGPIPPAMRALTAVIFLVVLLIVILSSLRNGKLGKRHSSHHERKEASI